MKDITMGRWGITSFQLKVLAIISMTVDHIGAIFLPKIWILRCIGRLAFPIFCFLLVEGFYHTRDVRKYMLRLGVFAILSEIPYDLAFGYDLWTFEKQNVFFTLLIGLGMIWLLDRERETVTKAVIVILAMWAAEFLRSDYGFMGVLLITVFWIFREKKAAQYLLSAGWNFFWPVRVQYAGALAVIPIALYNGEKGRNMKYFFYLFYPLHLLAFYLLARWLAI